MNGLVCREFRVTPTTNPAASIRVFVQWIKDSLAGRDPHIDKMGIAYMYVGA
ncbi:MAG TPA: hypothetical protein VMU26_22040 [Candidatus Polarisedimenticolia bacterium]|nr:hypothetical protein [Candidatus Polarisedimenticolia bacterium]